MPKATAPVPDDLRETLHWATASLREIYGPRLRRLILFGSQARGDATPGSDVDLLVVLDGPLNAYEEAKRTSRVATEAAAYRDTALSFVPLSEEKFATGRSSLARPVERDGIDLLEWFSEEISSGDPSTGPPSTPASDQPDR